MLGTREHTLLYEEPDERFSVYVRRTRSDQYVLAEIGSLTASRYTPESIWARARDGTQVPISLLYLRGIPRDGSAPMLLTAYGSYGAPYEVYFDSNQLSLLDRVLSCSAR